jgi:hypothetical protein
VPTAFASLRKCAKPSTSKLHVDITDRVNCFLDVFDKAAAASQQPLQFRWLLEEDKGAIDLSFLLHLQASTSTSRTVNVAGSRRLSTMPVHLRNDRSPYRA